MAQNIPFGRAFRKEHFMYRDGYVPLNHGSFGAFPRVVRDKFVGLGDQCEEDVDKYIRYDYPKQLEESRKLIAGLLNVDSSTVAFVPNATTAVNTVLRSLTWKPDDVIVTLDTTYSGFEKTVQYIVESTPASTQIVDIKWPCEDDQLVVKLEETIQAIRSSGRTPKLAVFDTISSLPGVRLPFERMVQKCTEMGVLSFLDGAQGIGQIKIDLGSTKPSFFTSNLHKWLFTPRGCAVLYVATEYQHLVRSSVPTSHGFKMLPEAGHRVVNNPFPPPSGSAFLELFSFVGTTNNDAYLTVPAALEFRKTVCGGEEKIIDYIINLAKVAGDKAAEYLGTEVMDNASGSLRQCAFANIRVPLDYGDGPGQIPVSEVGKIAQFLAEESVKAGTFFPIIFYIGAHWWRFSATVMLEEADILWGAELLKALCERVKQGEYVNSKSH